MAINRPASPLEWSYTFVVCGGDISNCRTLFTPLVLPLVNYSVTQRHLGYKEFELNNHLGNVIATVSDRKLPLKLCANYFNTFNERILDGIIPDNALVEIENNQLKVQPLQANGGVNITYPTSPQVNYVVSFDINLGTITPDDGLKAVFYGYNRSTNQYGPVTHTIAIDRNGTFTYTYTGQPQTDGYTKLYFSTGANTGNTLTPHYFYVDNFVVASTAAIEDGGTIGLDPCGPAFAVFNGYFPDLLMHTDYYAFGMEMPGRKWQASNYRYSHNSQEKETEIFAGANSAEFWMYDCRIGRRWNIDPVVDESLSSYACFNNNPIFYNDIDGDDPKKKKGGNYATTRNFNTGNATTDRFFKRNGGGSSNFGGNFASAAEAVGSFLLRMGAITQHIQIKPPLFKPSFVSYSKGVKFDLGISCHPSRNLHLGVDMSFNFSLFNRNAYGSGSNGGLFNRISNVIKRGQSIDVKEMSDIIGAINYGAFDSWIKTTPMNGRGTFPESRDIWKEKAKDLYRKNTFEDVNTQHVSATKISTVRWGKDDSVTKYPNSSNDPNNDTVYLFWDKINKKIINSYNGNKHIK